MPADALPSREHIARALLESHYVVSTEYQGDLFESDFTVTAAGQHPRKD